MRMKVACLAAVTCACSLGAAGTDDFQANPVPALGQNAKDKTAFDPTKKGPRVLFVGNSITLHGPSPKIGWTNSWGMAATARDRDYVHLLQKEIHAARPDAQCCLLTVPWSIEMTFFKADWKPEEHFEWARAFKPDVIVLFFGANVPKTYDAGTMTPPAARTFGAAVGQFLDYVDPGKKAFVLISQGFYIRPKLDAEKEVLAKKTDRTYAFVDLEDIRTRAEVHGLYNHPNDLGMKLIAARFWETLRKRLSPIGVGKP